MELERHEINYILDIKYICKYINELIKNNTSDFSFILYKTRNNPQMRILNEPMKFCSEMSIIGMNYIQDNNKLLYVDDMKLFFKDIFFKFNSGAFYDYDMSSDEKFKYYKYLDKNYKFKLNKINYNNRDTELFMRLAMYLGLRLRVNNKFEVNIHNRFKLNDNSLILEKILFEIKDHNNCLCEIKIKCINNKYYIRIISDKYKDTILLNYNNIRMLFDNYKKSIYPKKKRNSHAV